MGIASNQTVIYECDGPDCDKVEDLTGVSQLHPKRWLMLRSTDTAEEQWFCSTLCMTKSQREKAQVNLAAAQEVVEQHQAVLTEADEAMEMTG